MKQRHSFSLIEFMKTVVIFLLIVLMLVLMILLVIGQNGTREEILPQADRMVVYASGVEPKYASGMDTARVSPYLIAYRHGGGDTNIMHASDTVQKSYETLYPLLRNLFGSGAVGYTIGADDGEILWSVCMGLTDYIYIRYHTALPESVIRAYTYSEEDSETTSSVLDERVNGDSAYIRELFFVPAAQLRSSENLLSMALPRDPDAICAVACDERGTVTLYALAGAAQPVSAASADENSAFSDTARTAAVVSGTFDAYIASMEALSPQVQTGTLLSSDTAYGSAVSLHGLYSMPQITRERYDLAQSLYQDPQKLSAVLGLLGLRESDTDNYYTDGAGDRIYLNATGRLTISGGVSMIRYVSMQEGGLDLADYLGYASIGGEYLLSEYLRASDKLLSQLESLDAAFGGDALVCTLIDVKMASDASASADTLVLTYGYTYRGIPLLADNGEILPAMILRAGNGVITDLKLYPCHADISEEESYLLPQSVTLEALALEYAQSANTPSQPPKNLCMGYLSETKNGYGVYSADWIALMP